MKTCAYCGKETPEGAERCLECGTALKSEPGPINAPLLPSKHLMALFAILALYLPYSWLLFVHQSWAYQSLWLRMWLELPGLVIYFLVFKMIFGVGSWRGPDWIMHVFFSALTLPVAWAMVATAIKFRHKAVLIILVLVAFAGILSFLAYGLFAA